MKLNKSFNISFLKTIKNLEFKNFYFLKKTLKFIFKSKLFLIKFNKICKIFKFDIFKMAFSNSF